MRKITTLIFFTIVLTGCAPILENMPRFTHTAALMLGSEQSKVIHDAEHVLGEPIDVLIDAEISVEVRRYHFMSDRDMVLPFYKGTFLQLTHLEIGAALTSDTSNRQFEKLHGFILRKQGADGEVKMSFIFKKGQEF